MTRYLGKLGILLAACAALLISCTRWELPTASAVNAGGIALDRGAASLVSIRGPWQYYPKSLLYPLDFEQPRSGKAGASSPHPAGTGVASAAHGYATYRLTIDAPTSKGYDGILVPELGSAMALWVNGQKVAEEGRVGPSPRQEIPRDRGVVALFPRSGQKTRLVLQVSDFHGVGAETVAAPVLFGSATAVTGYVAAVRGLQLAIVAGLVLFFVIALLRYLFGGNWREWRPLLVAVLCLAGIAREAMAFGIPGLSVAVPLLQGLPWPFGVRIRLATYFFVLLAYFLVFISAGRGGLYRVPLRVLLGLSALGILLALFLPLSDFRLLGVAGGSFLSLGLLLFVLPAVGVPMPGRRRSGPPRVLRALGAILLLAAAANQVALYLGLPTLGYIAPLAILLYAILAAVEAGGDSGLLPFGRGGKSRTLQIEAFTEDLRTPLQGIVGLSESLLSGKMGELQDDQVVSLSLIAASGLRLSNAVADFADRDRLDRECLVLEQTSLAIEPLIDQVSEHLKPLLMVRSVEIRNELPRDLPPLYGDRRRVERILYNLLAEAIQRLERGIVVVAGQAAGEMVEITLTSTAADAPDAAERPQSERSAEFSRLGKEVAVELVQHHGGRLFERKTSDPPGYEISFTLPRSTSDEELALEISEQLLRLDEAELTPDASPPPGRPRRPGLRILIADDDLVGVQTMRNHLVREGFRVSVVFDGETALQQLEASPPDLLLVDAALAKVDGYEICRRVRSTYTSAELPVLILVDKDQEGRLMEGMTAGASDFISKPILPDEFLARIKTHINLAKMNTLYSRFVPVELLHFLGHENVIDLQLGDQIQREMTILFVDIRAFTNLSEGMTPQENFKFINSYLSRITPIIRENNGFIDKYIGDAILALYPGSPEDALRSAIRMVDYLKEYNGYRRNSGYRPINIGIGIHTGNLIVGIIGDSGRMQGTVISDAVNLASRVQDVTKLYGANIIISQDTFVRLENPTDYSFRFLGKVKVKGKNQTVSLFEIFDGEEPELVALKNRTKKDFEEAILMFSQRKFSEASTAFRRIAIENPLDRAASLFLNRSEFFLRREKANWLLK